MSFNFGTPKTAATGFTLPTTAQPTSTSAGFQLNSGAGDSKSQPKPNLFGTPPASTTISFGTKAATPSLNIGTSSNTSSPAAFSGFTSTSRNPPTSTSFGASPITTSALNFAATSTATTSAATPQFGFGTSTPTSAAAKTFTPIAATTAAASAASTPKLSFGVSAATLTPATTTTTSTNLLSTTVTTSTAAQSTVPATCLTFAQLEDSINKWTIDLEEQSKFFINQAKQLNAWDSLLISNGEKILSLNESIERVKTQQNQLDQELDFVLAQQKELEELIEPLEKELAELPVTDIDRNQMYQFSEVIDSQLKQMSEDLKEIIEHINESHKDEEISNPVTQISKILNAHMNSLQWIDTNTALISTHLEQITKMQDSNRRNISLNQSYL